MKNETPVHICSYAPATVSESSELSSACPIFRREKFADSTRYEASLVCTRQVIVTGTYRYIALRMSRGDVLVELRFFVTEIDFYAKRFALRLRQRLRKIIPKSLAKPQGTTLGVKNLFQWRKAGDVLERH